MRRQRVRNSDRVFNPANISNPAVDAQYANSATTPFLPAYKMTAVIPAIEAIFSFSNILFHQGNPKSNIYFTVGYTPLLYQTKLDVTNDNGQAYQWLSVVNSAGGFIGKRKDIQKAVKDGLDGNYETAATVRPRSPSLGSGDNTLAVTSYCIHWRWLRMAY